MRTQEVEDLFDQPSPPGRGRRYVMAAAGIATVLGLTAIAVASRSPGEAPAGLRIREGAVAITRGTDPARAAADGEDLRAGDVVRTDAGGRAQIDLFDGSLVRMDHDTELALRTMERSDDGPEISLGLNGGRSWNLVSDREPGRRFSVEIPGATLNIVGTTFLVDCRKLPRCFVVGFSGSVAVDSPAGAGEDVGPGECVRIAGAERIGPCDPHALGLIDAWVRENLAEDQQLEFDAVAPAETEEPELTPSPEAATQRPVRRTAPPRPAAVTPPPPPPASPDDTPEPTKTPLSFPTARPTKSPPPTPTPTSDPTPDPTPTPTPDP